MPPIPAVKNQANQLMTTSGTDLTYEEYSHLVLSAAVSYDNELPLFGTGQPTMASQLPIVWSSYVHDFVDDPATFS